MRANKLQTELVQITAEADAMTECFQIAKDLLLKADKRTDYFRKHLASMALTWAASDYDPHGLEKVYIDLLKEFDKTSA